MSYDLAAEPTGVQCRQCSYFRRLRARWMRQGSSSVEINVHSDALATEPTGVQWRQCSCFRRPRSQWMRPGSTYNTMLLLQQTYGPSGCYQVQTSRSTSRESGWSPQSTMFLLQTSGGRTFCCRSLRWRQFALMLQR